MGVDLMLLPLEPVGPPEKPDFCSWNILDLTRRCALWDAINDLPQQLLNGSLRTPLGVFEAEGEYEADNVTWDIRRIKRDGLGSPLQWINASDLTPLCVHEGVQDNFQNRAAWAYLAELSPDARIVLYWY